MRGLYVAGLLIHTVKRISCPMCNGIGWSIHKQWKLKCLLCDADGWAILDDCLDYYTHIEPDAARAKLLESKKTPENEVGDEDSQEEEDETDFTMSSSESEGSYTV